MRANGRNLDELRPIQLSRSYTRYAEGSVLVEFGLTKVLCNATVVSGVPKFLKDSGQGWITAEYSMLPRATHERTSRESTQGKPSGRTMEIQRLIGRALRSAINLKDLGEYTITIDCDVIQADGGTRTAAITGACVALYDAVQYVIKQKNLKTNPFKGFVAAVSVGLVKGQAVLDLDYAEDSNAETDMNLVMNEDGQFIEIQGTAEQAPFSEAELQQLLNRGRDGIRQLIEFQKASVA